MKKFDKIIIAVVIIIVLGLIGKSCGSSDNKALPTGEIRCYYCGKVIFNNGKPIHCTHKFDKTYICDYCGIQNVIR